MTTNPQLARLANYLYGGTTDPVVSPAQFYVGLATGSVSTAGVITGEPTGGGYQRVAVSNDKTSFSTATNNGNVTNKIDVTFPESTTAWGNITTVFISDQATGGTAIYYATLSVPKTVQQNVTVYFKGDPNGASGDITLSVSN